MKLALVKPISIALKPVLGAGSASLAAVTFMEWLKGNDLTAWITFLSFIGVLLGYVLNSWLVKRYRSVGDCNGMHQLTVERFDKMDQKLDNIRAQELQVIRNDVLATAQKVSELSGYVRAAFEVKKP